MSQDGGQVRPPIRRNARTHKRRFQEISKARRPPPGRRRRWSQEQTQSLTDARSTASHRQRSGCPSAPSRYPRHASERPGSGPDSLFPIRSCTRASRQRASGRLRSAQSSSRSRRACSRSACARGAPSRYQVPTSTPWAPRHTRTARTVTATTERSSGQPKKKKKVRIRQVRAPPSLRLNMLLRWNPTQGRLERSASWQPLHARTSRVQGRQEHSQGRSP